jgi:hypothetical protein
MSGFRARNCSALRVPDTSLIAYGETRYTHIAHPLTKAPQTLAAKPSEPISLANASLRTDAPSDRVACALE